MGYKLLLTINIFLLNQYLYAQNLPSVSDLRGDGVKEMIVNTKTITQGYNVTYQRFTIDTVSSTTLYQLYPDSSYEVVTFNEPEKIISKYDKYNRATLQLSYYPANSNCYNHITYWEYGQSDSVLVYRVRGDEIFSTLKFMSGDTQVIREWGSNNISLKLTFTIGDTQVVREIDYQNKDTLLSFSYRTPSPNLHHSTSFKLTYKNGQLISSKEDGPYMELYHKRINGQLNLVDSILRRYPFLYNYPYQRYEINTLSKRMVADNVYTYTAQSYYGEIMSYLGDERGSPVDVVDTVTTIDGYQMQELRYWRRLLLTMTKDSLPLNTVEEHLTDSGWYGKVKYEWQYDRKSRLTTFIARNPFPYKQTEDSLITFLTFSYPPKGGVLVHDHLKNLITITMEGDPATEFKVAYETRNNLMSWEAAVKKEGITKEYPFLKKSKKALSYLPMPKYLQRAVKEELPDSMSSIEIMINEADATFNLEASRYYLDGKLDIRHRIVSGTRRESYIWDRYYDSFQLSYYEYRNPDQSGNHDSIFKYSASGEATYTLRGYNEKREIVWEEEYDYDVPSNSAAFKYRREYLYDDRGNPILEKLYSYSKELDSTILYSYQVTSYKYLSDTSSLIRRMKQTLYENILIEIDNSYKLVEKVVAHKAFCCDNGNPQELHKELSIVISYNRYGGSDSLFSSMHILSHPNTTVHTDTTATNGRHIQVTTEYMVTQWGSGDPLEERVKDTLNLAGSGKSLPYEYYRVMLNRKREVVEYNEYGLPLRWVIEHSNSLRRLSKEIVDIEYQYW